MSYGTSRLRDVRKEVVRDTEGKVGATVQRKEDSTVKGEQVSTEDGLREWEKEITQGQNYPFRTNQQVFGMYGEV